ncbi:hypothetical protein [Haloferula sargassicola]|uniref:Uncharacterized protein n=1 Tax=Haloferula sargassicola TaxID=490096 RepID=A0ABP9UPA2_9BACT
MSYVYGRTGLLLDGADLPLVMLVDNGALKIARRTSGGQWVLDEIADLLDPHDHGVACSLIRGPEGRPMVSYYDSLERDVMVAWKPAAGPLTIKPLGGQQYRLEWGGETTGVWIDRSPSLDAGSWIEAAGPVTGTHWTTTQPEDRMFYRVRSE